MKVLNKSEWAILTFVLVYSSIPTFGGLFRVLELAGGPAIAPENLRALEIPLPIVLHILGSFVFCLLGAIQFLPSIRLKHFYSFPIGLQGNLLYWTRIILGTLMFCFIVWSVLAIRSQKVLQHIAYMLRAYAIGQGASTQTFIGIGWIILHGTEAAGLLRDAIMVFAWALNLLIAEALIWAFWEPKRLSAASILSKKLY